MSQITTAPKNNVIEFSWLTVLRVALGLILIWKGINFVRDITRLEFLIKQTGVGIFTQNDDVLALVVTVLTLLCGFFITVGLFTRIASIVQIPVVLVALLFVHMKTVDRNGFELVLTIAVLVLLILFAIKGSGTLSADEYFRRGAEQDKTSDSALRKGWQEFHLNKFLRCFSNTACWHFKIGIMKKAMIKMLRIWLYAALATGVLISCRNKVTGDGQPKNSNGGFPQQASSNRTASGNTDFVTAAKAVTPGVVHIKTTYGNSQRPGSFLEGIYGRDGSRMTGSGSGVVISADGYIATNNHVVENASGVEVIFPDRRSFAAKIVGRDPNTDLALLKVEAKDLPFVALGNSDNALVGEWVLAVGYPYSMNTTVTAGIISAKGRSIGIINTSSTRNQQGSSAVESFIQTDAAINPGNSGGALVNMNGELIGINTAIASLTGSYAGYAFAIPVNLAKKILDDLKEFGTVKRGLLGVSFPSPLAEDQYLKQQGITPGSVKGVFITAVQKGSAADAAGLQEGDIIQRIDGVELYSSAEFSERIARHRPGDKINIDYLRNGKSQNTTAALKSEETQRTATTDAQSLQKIYDRLGATFAPLNESLKQRYNLESGVIVTEIQRGGFFDQLGIPPGTVIAYINGRSVNNPADIDEALMAAQNSRIQILGIAPDGSRIAFNFSLGA